MLLNMLRPMWMYRGFILSNVKREFQLKYRNSLLGAAWTVLNPIAMILVYTVIFSQVMRAKLPGMNGQFAYSIYLCAGLLTWGLFSEIVSRSQGVFIENANLIKKINFPKICLAVNIIISALINFGIIFIIFSVFLVASSNFPGLSYFAIIPIIFVQVLFSISLGIILGTLNVFFRDVGQLFGVALQFWFWATPIVYPIEILPKSLHSLFLLNPMATLISSYQSILVNGLWPNWLHIGIIAIISILLCFCAIWLFHKYSDEMVDEL